MATKTNSAEGLSNGVALTAGSGGNTGGASGDYFPTITITAAPTIEGSTAQAAYGTKSIHFAGTSADRGYLRWTSLGSDRCAGYFHFRWNGSLPATLGDLVNVRNGTSNIFSITQNVNNTIAIKDGTPTVLATFTVPSYSGTAWYRCEFEIIVGTTTSNGSVAVRLYALGSTTALSGCTLAPAATSNTGTTNLAEMWIGKITTSSVMNFYLDALSLVTGSTTQAALPGANSVPVINAGPDQYVVAGAGALHLNGTVNDLDGTAATGAWSFISGPDTPTVSTSVSGTGTATITATADVDVVPGNYIFQLDGTDNATAAGVPDQMHAYVRGAAAQKVDVFAVDITDWSVYGGAATGLEALTSGSGDDGIEVVNPASSVAWVTLPNLGDGTLNVQITGLKVGVGATVTRAITVYKNDGATQIYATTQSPNDVLTEQPVSLNGSALAGLTTDADKVGLRMKIVSTAS